MVSLTQVLVTITSVYILHTAYSFYELFKVPTCVQSVQSPCIQAYLHRKPMMQLLLYTSVKQSKQSSLVWSSHLFRVGDDFEKEVKVEVPMVVRMNGSMRGKVVLRQLQADNLERDQAVWSNSRSFQLTSFTLPQPTHFKLMGDDYEDGKQPKLPVDLTRPLSHWRSKLFVSVIEDTSALDPYNMPQEIAYYLKMFSEQEYLPLFFVDELSLRIKDLMQMNESSAEMPLKVVYRASSFGKLKLWTQLQHSLSLFITMGFTDKDLDEVKSIFVDTNLLLLLLTFFVSAFHLLFDFLAFKNDISFWRKRKHMTGLSTWSISWRSFSSIIIFFFLLDQQTSLLVLVPAGISLIIEMWKLTKAFKVRVWREGWKIGLTYGGAESEAELQTDVFDTQAMKTLSYFLVPLVFLGAVYSLVYTPHKSWYSWTIQSLSNGVYAFGFIFMLPQLFINYKLKSVAHLPWKAFTYKAFNTFIDDVFAFIITMPTTHRLACFRDDLVFAVYLYQRWLYPVDKKRVNEFGQSFDDDVSKKIDDVIEQPDEKKKKDD